MEEDSIYSIPLDPDDGDYDSDSSGVSFVTTWYSSDEEGESCVEEQCPENMDAELVFRNPKGSADNSPHECPFHIELFSQLPHSDKSGSLENQYECRCKACAELVNPMASENSYECVLDNEHFAQDFHSESEVNYSAENQHECGYNTDAESMSISNISIELMSIGKASTELLSISKATTELASISNTLSNELACISNTFSTELVNISNKLTTELASISNTLSSELMSISDKSTKLMRISKELSTELVSISNKSTELSSISNALSTDLLSISNKTIELVNPEANKNPCGSVLHMEDFSQDTQLERHESVQNQYECRYNTGAELVSISNKSTELARINNKDIELANTKADDNPCECILYREDFSQDIQLDRHDSNDFLEKQYEYRYSTGAELVSTSNKSTELVSVSDKGTELVYPKADDGPCECVIYREDFSKDTQLERRDNNDSVRSQCEFRYNTRAELVSINGTSTELTVSNFLSKENLYQYIIDSGNSLQLTHLEKLDNSDFVNDQYELINNDAAELHNPNLWAYDNTNECVVYGENSLQPPHLERHVDNDSSGNQYESIICNEKFISDVHSMSRFREKLFRCITCNAKFSRQCNLFTHYNKVHGVGKSYQCDGYGRGLTARNLRPRRVTVCSDESSSNFASFAKTHSNENSYACGICGKKFSRIYQLNGHKHVHLRKKPSGDALLFKSRTRIVHFNNLRRIYDEIKPYKRNFCIKTFSGKKNVYSHHRRIHSGKKPHECNFCGKAFAQKGNVDIHRRIHTGEKPYVCDFCGKAFAQKGNVDIHRRIHTGEKPYVCDIFSKAFAQKANVDSHRRNHTGEKPYECDLCGENFTHFSSLLCHKMLHSEEEPLHITNSESILSLPTSDKFEMIHAVKKKSYECSFCCKSFLSRSGRNTHRKKHLDEELYEEIANSEIPLQGWKLHARDNILSNEKQQEYDIRNVKSPESYCMEKHSTILQTAASSKRPLENFELVALDKVNFMKKPYECILCRKIFTNSASLKLHMRIHTGEKPYECEFCGKRFSNITNVECHRRIHTGEKPYECPFCDYRFTQLSHLLQHKRLHTGEKPYNCRICGEKFRQLSNLIYHNFSHAKKALNYSA